MLNDEWDTDIHKVRFSFCLFDSPFKKYSEITCKEARKSIFKCGKRARHFEVKNSEKV